MDYIAKCDRPKIGRDGRCLVEVRRYRGAEPRQGDRVFMWLAELNGGDGLHGVARVEAVTDGNPVVLGLLVSNASPLRPLNKTMLKPFRDQGPGTAEGGLADKLYKHALLKVAELDTIEANYLAAFFETISAEDRTADTLALAAITKLRRENNRSWKDLRRACRDLLGETVKHSTPAVEAASKTFGRNASKVSGLDFAAILDLLDSHRLGVEGENT